MNTHLIVLGFLFVNFFYTPVLTSSVLAHITESYLTVSRALQILISLHVCYFITLIDLCSCFLFCVSTIVQLRSDSMLINGYVMLCYVIKFV